MPLTLHSRFAGDIYITQCSGPIILGPEVSALEATLNDASARRFHQFVLSLADATRLDSVGLGLIVRFTERLRHRGGDIRLASPPPFLTNLLNLTNVSQVLRSYPTEDEAILSFLREPAPEAAHTHRGPRVLFVDDSADLCVFVRTVLEQHDFNVRSATLVRDARLLLQSEGADVILTGPGTPNLHAAQVLAALQPIAPKTVALSLEPNFKSLDAHQAAESLLSIVRSHPSA